MNSILPLIRAQASHGEAADSSEGDGRKGPDSDRALRADTGPAVVPGMRREAGIIPEEAARHKGVNARTIYRWIDAGVVHIVELPGGDVLVCLNSIEKEI